MRTPLRIRLAPLAWCLLMAPATQAADTQAIEDACRQAAAEDRVATKEMDDYMEDCMADALQNLDDEANPLSGGDVRFRHGGDAEMVPEGDQEPAPVD